MSTQRQDTNSISIVGGGMSGLTAAAILARAGKDVTLYEKASAVGGRALLQRPLYSCSGNFSRRLEPKARILKKSNNHDGTGPICIDTGILCRARERN